MPAMSPRPMTGLLILFVGSAIALAGCAGSVPSSGRPVRVAKNSGGTVRRYPLERYLVGVLQKEVNANWPLEALKAQAVAARTYATYRLEHPRDGRFDVLSNTNDQAFESHSHPPRSIIRAVQETEGEILTDEGKAFEAFFHSCCGGHTESADAVWPGYHASPLLVSQEDLSCHACPNEEWSFEMTREELKKILENPDRKLKRSWALTVGDLTASGRVRNLVMRSGQKRFVIDGSEFRKLVGYESLKSTLFTVTTNGESVVFEGHGFGHGVGLCQWGAKGMADHGSDYREILTFYYPGAILTDGKAVFSSPVAPSEEGDPGEIEQMIQTLPESLP